MRARTILLVLAVLLIAGAAVAAFTIPSLLDPARVRAALERAASEHLGATVTIRGPVRFTLLPRPVLQAEQVSLRHGAPGDRDGLAVTADTLSARLDLTELAHFRFAAAALVLDGAQLAGPFPFDVRVLTAGRPASLRATTISLRRARIRLGPILAEEVDATLTADRLTGDVAVSGTFRIDNSSTWRGGLRLSRAGGDGSAALNATLDETRVAEGLTAALTGQLAGDGGFAGQITIAGPDLGRLLPAPPTPFTIKGRASLAGGIAALDDGALSLDGVPSRLDISLHLPPQPRLDLHLEASRLDLDAFRQSLVAASQLWPLSLDLAAEAATLAGGAWRDVKASFVLTDGHVTLHNAQGVGPGGASVRAEGTIDLTATTSRLDVRFDAPDLRASAVWLGRLVGLSDGAAPSLFRTCSGHAMVETTGREISAHNIAATLDGAALRGHATLSVSDGVARPRLMAGLSVDRLDLTSRVDMWQGGGIAWPWPGLDAVIRLVSPRVSVPGLADAALDTDVEVRDGAVDVHYLTAATPGWHVSAKGGRTTDGRWSDVELAVTADRAASLATILPGSWRDTLAAWPGLLAQPLRASLSGGGTLAAPSGALTTDVGALHVEASVRPDSGDLRGTILLRHPSLSALAANLDVSAGFLGEGDVKASADVVVAGDVLAANRLDLRAGLMRAGGDARLDLSGKMPLLTGHLQAPLLRLPAFDWHAQTPLPLSWLTGWNAALDIEAARVEGFGPPLADLRTRATLSASVLALSGLSATLAAGGRLSGQLGLDASALPPRATADLTFAGVGSGEQPWRPVNLLASGLSGSVQLEARGFAPATMLATLRGEARVSARPATLVGVDVGRLDAELSDGAVRAALGGGRTVLDSLDMSARFNQGLATVQADAVAPGGVRLGASGTVDLPDGTVDLGLVITPAIHDGPRIGLRLSGSADHAAATPALAELARWRTLRP